MKKSVAEEKLPPLAKAVLFSALILGAAAATNTLIFYRTPPLTSDLEGGDIRYYPTEVGDVFYQKFGAGPALLLVHGIGAGESSFEYRNVWRKLAETHTVYAIDLVGFGKSDKPPIDYDAETYIGLIADFVRDVITGADGHQSTAVIASSLSAAFVVAAVDRDPSRFGRLVLVCPTGIEELVSPVTRFSAASRAFLRTPILGTTLYNSIAGKAFIRWYLKRMIYAEPSSVTEAIIEKYHVSAHQIGGERVLPSFVCRFLNVSIKDALGRIDNPVLIVWGREARQSPLAQSEAFLDASLGRARLTIIEGAGLLPHDEKSAAFLGATRDFLDSA